MLGTDYPVPVAARGLRPSRGLHFIKRTGVCCKSLEGSQASVSSSRNTGDTSPCQSDFKKKPSALAHLCSGGLYVCDNGPFTCR